MTITIGRIGVPTAEGGDGASLDDPLTIDRDGRHLTLAGLHTDTTQARLVWVSRQILGLADGEEPVVAVTSSAEPNIDGYYRVLGAQIAQEQGSTRAGGYARWQVQLEAVANYRQAQIEVATAYGLRTNGRGITTYDAHVSFPGDAIAIDGPFQFDTSGSRSVGDGSGNAVVYLQDSGISTAGTSGVSRYVVPPANYYVGGCRIEHDLGSATYRHAVGRPDFPPVPTPGSAVLRLQNGLVRNTFTYGNGTVSDWQVEWWDGTQWDAATEFAILGFGTHGELAYHAPSVLRNTAEACAIRFRVVGASLQDRLTLVDFSIRRGQRWVTVTVTGLTAPISGWRAQFNSAVASTAITGGIRRTANNGGGNTELLASSTNATNDLVNGRLTTTSITSETFGIGCAIGGSAATGQNTAANQMDEWFCALSERALVVAN